MRDDQTRARVVDAADELKVLCAAWLLADDDDRRTKALWVSPTTYRRWKRLAEGT